MSELVPIGEVFIRALDKLEGSNPGDFIPVPDLEGVMRREDIVLPDDVSMPHFLDFLLRTGWIETDNNGFDTVEQSFRISAKGQMRAASSVDYADIYSKAVNSIPMAPDGPIEIKSEGPAISSARWTGTQYVLVDAKVITDLKIYVSELHTTVHAMHFESNSDSQDLKCLTDALVAVCSMAEPEVTIIDRILASPKFKAYAGLFALVATIRGALGI